ncbi:hypothetical protein FXN63_19195 [Pigmentiphaga aceris]|uniref:Uncharacterized protein n=1 Tax=Pigmentiphaga aceris TaxID=1940612 RepID=A0A5C0AZC1_9BURK|nr:hypothetical protein [Pigmentiphaga aceris]QEI07728.1 hypothetical protein FXN63_19195 [Pigmentiphaga aceris]
MPKRTTKPNPEKEAFKRDLLRSIQEMKSGQFARVTTFAWKTTAEETASWNRQPVNGTMPSKPTKGGERPGS